MKSAGTIAAALVAPHNTRDGAAKIAEGSEDAPPGEGLGGGELSPVPRNTPEHRMDPPEAPWGWRLTRCWRCDCAGPFVPIVPPRPHLLAPGAMKIQDLSFAAGGYGFWYCSVECFDAEAERFE